MVSRRILRIKVMQALYTYYKHKGESSINQVEKELLFSINKTYDLYHYLMVLIVDVANFAQSRIDIARNKKLPSREDLNPNTRFIDNAIINQIRINNDLLRYNESHKLNWANHPELIKSLFAQLTKEEFYKKYMDKETSSYKEDKDLVIDFFQYLLPNSELLFSILEEQSIFWNDEVEFVISAIIKTLKKFKFDQAENANLMPLYKNDEDRVFTKDLFRKCILKQKDQKEIIEKFCQNWDFERIAFMDILLMEMALTEVTEFASIPTRVTFNEYIELSKFYSTTKSKVFINGILDRSFEYLKENNKIAKQGRGLIGEV